MDGQDEQVTAISKTRTAHMATTTVKVDGMTFGACTSAVEAGFKDVQGAGAVSVSLIMGRAVVHHDPEVLPADKVAEIIEDRGFDAEVLSSDLPMQTTTDRRPSQSSHNSPMTITTISVGGMTCGACTSAVEGGFRSVAGIKTMSVNLLSERAVVEHDASIINAGKVAEIIEDCGFDAKLVDTRLLEPMDTTTVDTKNSGNMADQAMTTTVSVEGMTCGACTSAVEGAFKNVEGLVHFKISLLAERAVIVHDPTKLSSDQVVEIIEDAGFDAKVVSSTSGASRRLEKSSTIQLKIYGLFDASAATALESLLREITGVTEALVSLATSRITITYDPSLTGLRALVESVEKAGYNALVADTDDNNAQLESLAKTKEIQEWWRAFIYSLSFAIPVFCISMLIPMFLPAYLNFGAFRIIPGLYLGDLLSALLTIPVQFGIGKRFYISAFKSIKHKSPTMDVLVILGTSAAFFFSCFAVLIAVLIPPHNKPGTVFDTSTMLITFITLGRYLENRAKGQTSKALSRLMSLAPSMATIYEDPIAAEKAAEGWDAPLSPRSEKKDATLLNDEKNSSHNASVEKVIPTELIQVGDIVILRPGDKVPADGTVTRGESYVDESMVTGEAMPILKKKASLLMAGTVNGGGRVDFRVTRAGKDTQLSQIVNLVQEAQTSRAPIQRMADYVAGYFVPIIIALGLTTFVGWMILSHVLPNPPKVFVEEQSGGKFMVCLKLCISVIVFACPCALGLATPTAVLVGTGVGAENGILVKGGAALETATKVTHIVLDKTGTLTFGKLNVAKINLDSTWSSNDWRRRLWWTMVGVAELSSEHPIGKAITAAAREELGLGDENGFDGSVGAFEVTVGCGIYAEIEPHHVAERTRYPVLVGNAAFMKSKGVTIPQSADPGTVAAASSSPKPDDSAGMTYIHVAISGQYAGTLAMSDTLKPSAAAAITALHRLGISTSLVTGDTYATALYIAQQVGIPKKSIRASVSPGQKQLIIGELQSHGEVVAMVGDGINDSPALASANVGIGLVSGSDIAVEAADIVIMRPDDMLNIPASLCLSRSIFNRIKANLIWACVYNLIGLPFAMGLFLPFGGVMLPPMAAGLMMAASSVSVVSSSLLLKLWKRPKWLNQETLERSAGSQPLPKKSRLASIGPISQVRDTVFGVLRKSADRERGAYVPLGTVEPV